MYFAAEFKDFPPETAVQGLEVSIKGVVTFVFTDREDGFTIADLSHSSAFAVRVAPSLDSEVCVGDVVLVMGKTGVDDNGVPIVIPESITPKGAMQLESDPFFKVKEYKRGWRHMRRNKVVGVVIEAGPMETKRGRSVTEIIVDSQDLMVPLHVHGPENSFRGISGAYVEAVGVVVTEFDSRMRPVRSHLEVAKPSDVHILSRDRTGFWRFLAFCAGGIILIGFAIIVSLRVSIMRERSRERLLAEDRKRIAGDLHDTIEQYMASVKMMLTAALSTGNVPEDTRSLMLRANDMLAYAKGEVRTAVMDLRGDGVDKTLTEALKSVADTVGSSGAVRLRTHFRGLPQRLANGRQLNLLMIVREAITNAVKHGKAGWILLVSDPVDGGFSLRIANDGEPFDRASALGPSAGHYGIAGMEHRARKCGFDLSFGRKGKWTIVKVEVRT